MKQLAMVVLLVVMGFTAKAQTAKELIGKWKLVKETKDGVDKQIKEDTYQVFREGGVFQGIVGSKTRKGKWTLSDDNKIITVKISVISVIFNVEYFDASKRIVTNDVMGRLEYEKVSE